MPKAYVIAQVEVTDPEAYAAYRQQVPASLEAHGGRFIVRGGAQEVTEGDWPTDRTVVLEFASRADARAWYDGPAYAEAKKARWRSAVTNMLIVEGV